MANGNIRDLLNKSDFVMIGVCVLLAAACLFGLWLAGLERETPARPLEPAITRGGAR